MELLQSPFQGCWGPRSLSYHDPPAPPPPVEPPPNPPNPPPPNPPPPPPPKPPPRPPNPPGPIQYQPRRLRLEKATRRKMIREMAPSGIPRRRGAGRDVSTLTLSLSVTP